MPFDYTQMFHFFTDRWDGKGLLHRASAYQIPMPLRIAKVARDIAYQRLLGGEAYALETVRGRAGHAFDPDVVGVFASNSAAPEFPKTMDPSRICDP